MNLKSYSRGFLTFFGLLDAVLIGQHLGNITQADILPNVLPLGGAALAWLKALFLVSLIFSAIGLCLEKKWALLLTYGQFPFRLIVPMLSFGFLAHIPFLAKNFGGQILLITIFVLEIVRLIMTIQLQRGGGGSGKRK